MLSCLLQLACSVAELHLVEGQDVYAGLFVTVGVFCGKVAFCGRTTSLCLWAIIMSPQSVLIALACWPIGLPKPCLELVIFRQVQPV